MNNQIYKKAFIPDSFKIPNKLNTESFHFRVLDDEVAMVDFKAVMSSQKRLKGMFGPTSEWPKGNMTIEENIKSLKAHKQQFDSREAFAYSVFNGTNDRCLGSVYIDPSQSQNFDCEVYLWIRDDDFALDTELYQVVLSWLQRSWLFSKIAFPGRSITWEDWAVELNI